VWARHFAPTSRRAWAPRAAVVVLCATFACADEAETETEGSFSALTYNVHGLPPEITGDDTADRMVQIAPLINGYDLLALQEDFLSDNHDTLTADTDHSEQEWFSEIQDGRIYPSGLALLSRLPLVEYWTEHYEDCNGLLDGASDCLASKGFQVMRFELTDGALLDVYNSHLEAGGSDEDNAAREGHVDQLVAAMNGYSAGEAVLFLGDTNLHGGDPADDPLIADWLEQAGIEDACDLIGCDEPGRIDRALLRSSDSLSLEVGAWSVEPEFYDGDGVPLSDHDAIAVQIDWSAL